MSELMGANNPHIFNFFDEIVVLNLPSRTDRLEHIKKEFKGIEVKFFEGIENRVSGFNESMYNILNEYKDCQRLLVIEDDFKFLDASGLEQSLSELPEDWDLISLGSNLRSEHFKYSNSLYELKDAWMTHGVGYSNKMINWILENYDKKLVYDEWLRVNVYPKFKCYMTNPIVAWQIESYSSIWNVQANYEGFLFNTRKFMK